MSLEADSRMDLSLKQNVRAALWGISMPLGVPVLPDV
jgi:hypothetical protein